MRFDGGSEGRVNGPSQAAVDESPAQQRGQAPRGTTPLYIVCSLRRSVGKTLLARLLTEFYVLDGRPVAAFDLGEEEPQLADYLPDRATIGDLGTIRGQMAIFDRLVAEAHVIKILDVSHRAFKDFFMIAKTIGFFEEARRRSIEPVILFIIDATPKSTEGFALLRDRFSEASLLAVRNGAIARGLPFRVSVPNEKSQFASLEIPMLSPTLAEQIAEPSFSLAEFWRTAPGTLPARPADELRRWMKRMFIQFREIELRLMCDGILSQLN